MNKKEIEENIIYKNTTEEEIPNLESYNFLVREISQGIGFETLMENLEKGYYIIPKNQRNYVWTQEQVQELATSLVKGFPIPPIYGYRNSENQLVILDGQQRLLSLYLYYKGKYFKNITGQAINLKGIFKENKEKTTFEMELEKQYGLKDVEYYIEDGNEKKINITYENLSNKDKRAINRPITVVEIMVQTFDDNKEEIYYKIFGNLNQGGTPLKNQELRNGIYQSKFYDMLHKINDENEKWRKIYGPKHKHSRDLELLLRFAATEFYFKLENEKFDLSKYKNSYPKLLNDFSKSAMSFDEKTIEIFESNIEKFIDRIELIPETKIENLLLESLYLASIYIKGDYKINNELINKIKESGEYNDCVSSSSSTKRKVENRLNFVYKELKEWSEEYGV